MNCRLKSCLPLSFKNNPGFFCILHTPPLVVKVGGKITVFPSYFCQTLLENVLKKEVKGSPSCTKPAAEWPYCKPSRTLQVWENQAGLEGPSPAVGLEAVNAAVCLTSHAPGKERGLVAAVSAMIYEIRVVPLHKSLYHCIFRRGTAVQWDVAGEGAWLPPEGRAWPPACSESGIKGRVQSRSPAC